MLKFVSFSAAFLLSTATLAAPGGQAASADAKPARATTGVMRYDANGDGFVDRDEWNTGQEARFKQLDVNGDGKLTQEELFTRPGATADEAPPTARQAQRRAAYFERLDADKDGFISKAEFMVQAGRNFARCDQDKDGRINTAECRQALRRKPVQPANADR
jgi:hypothetical protein